jgi:hypothetical protein
VDWFASGLPREGQTAGVLYAGELIDADPPTCALSDRLATVRAILDRLDYGFCLVVNDRRVVLGRVRRSGLRDADDAASAESVMESAPRTVRANVPAKELLERLVKQELDTAIVTTPGGCLIGVFHRAEAEQRLARSEEES